MSCTVCPVCGRPKDCDQQMCDLCEDWKETEEMVEGYRAMAAENLQFARGAMEIAYEVFPEWK